jgi:hypothetical protein
MVVLNSRLGLQVLRGLRVAECERESLAGGTSGGELVNVA